MSNQYGPKAGKFGNPGLRHNSLQKLIYHNETFLQICLKYRVLKYVRMLFVLVILIYLNLSVCHQFKIGKYLLNDTFF